LVWFKNSKDTGSFRGSEDSRHHEREDAQYYDEKASTTTISAEVKDVSLNKDEWRLDGKIFNLADFNLSL
jgi:hypothetical protein